MLQAAIMTGVSNARKNRQASEMAQQTKPTRSSHYYSYENAPHRRNTIFEPRPDPTYSDINSSFYEQPEAEAFPATSRTPVRYIGAKTDSRYDYSRPNAGRKLVRRETVIASWKYLKNERERALGIKEDSDIQKPPTRNASDARKVSRSHSDRQNGGLKKFSSKRKSVIYTYDPVKKVLNKAYTFESEDSGDESEGCHSSVSSRVSDRAKEITDDDFQCKRSSSFTKIKTLFMRVFNNKSL